MTKEIAIGLGLALVALFGHQAVFGNTKKKNKNTHKQHQQHNHHHQYHSVVALLGDVGGTNIRLQLVQIKPPNNHPQRQFKKAQYLVQNQQSFQEAIRKFLIDVEIYPKVASIAMAGPVKDNKLSMANVPKWGQIDGKILGQNLNIPDFRLMNDFQANTYGLLIVPETDFINLNGFQVQYDKTVGIMGPGTGLGNSILYTSPFRVRKRVYVLTSEGGHTDVPYIDDEVMEYIKYFKKHIKVPGIEHISLQRSFCGPAIPMMYRFFAEKYPDAEKLQQHSVNSKQIIKKCLEQNPTQIFDNVFKLFMKIYEAAMGNYMAQHMCTGGLILVGSLSNAIYPKMKNMDLLKEWKLRHVQFSKNIQEVPIVICKEIDLGLKGAFVMARRIIADQQHE